MCELDYSVPLFFWAIGGGVQLQSVTRPGQGYGLLARESVLNIRRKTLRGGGGGGGGGVAGSLPPSVKLIPGLISRST